jgi:hypothetical protein
MCQQLDDDDDVIVIDASLSGTLGRVVGDLFLTANSAVGDDKLAVVNMLFLPLCLSLVLSLVVIYGSYEKLS